MLSSESVSVVCYFVQMCCLNVALVIRDNTELETTKMVNNLIGDTFIPIVSGVFMGIFYFEHAVKCLCQFMYDVYIVFWRTSFPGPSPCGP